MHTKNVHAQFLKKSQEKILYTYALTKGYFIGGAFFGGAPPKIRFFWGRPPTFGMKKPIFGVFNPTPKTLK